jgi:GNAT superfamily N-acetyltransferase
VSADIHPLTADRWDDLVALFGETRGGNGGCWCMYWRSSGSQKAFYAGDREQRRLAFAERVRGGACAPGLIAYCGGEPVGWVAVAPRDELPRFATSKASRLDEAEDADAVWAISCFFIDRRFRGQGLMQQMIHAAVAHAAENGAKAVDAAPLDVSRSLVAGEGFVGIASAFERAGFEVIRRASTAKPLMRRALAN